MELRRRKGLRRSRDSRANHGAGRDDELVTRLEARRSHLSRALDEAPSGVSFVVVGSDYLPMRDAARQLADLEVLLNTVRYRSRHAAS